VRGWAGVGACSAEGVCGGRNLAKIRFHNCARTRAPFQNRSERGTLCEKQLSRAPPFLTFSSAERLEPLFKISYTSIQVYKYPGSNLSSKYRIQVYKYTSILRIQVSRRLVNGILSERHDILKRLRSDRQDAVCAQSKFH
jgi:hypothetical protein